MKIIYIIVCVIYMLYPISIMSQNGGDLNKTDVVSIDIQKKGAAVASSMYGVFFEEINHAGDGGLYAELVRNRSFEDMKLPPKYMTKEGKLIAKPVKHHLTGKTDTMALEWDDKAVPGWHLATGVSALAKISLTQEAPKFSSAPTNLKVEIQKGDSVRLINEGYWGMSIKAEELYMLRTIIRSTNYTGKIVAKLLSCQNKELAAKELEISRDNTWKDQTSLLCAHGTDKAARLVLEFNGVGTVWLDYVSLFPQKTFKQRSNGFRIDLAEMISDLKPAFVRWPGGAIVGGVTLENRFDWKKTLGDPAARPGEYLTWGYRCTYGMGYYEMLQFCEDIGAKAMFVCNVGLADIFQSGEACPDDSIDFFIDDCLNAIEYALGGIDTEWGSRRAADGHPAPFPLAYVEVGNEHWGKEYDRRYDMFYKAIKKKYPNLTIISNHALWEKEKVHDDTGLIDPHWYGEPEFFWHNVDLFDSISRNGSKIYVGEYACIFKVGSGNMEAALAEAAFMCGMEQNGDLVKMTSYAPLLQNRHDKDWLVNMIWFDSDEVVGRSSYYVQKLFAENRPTYNVNVKSFSANEPQGLGVQRGGIGFGSQKSYLKFKDLKVIVKGKNIDFASLHQKAVKGEWDAKKGMLVQNSNIGESFYWVDGINCNDYTLECKMYKSGLKEGFFIYHSLSDDAKTGVLYNIGCWTGQAVAVKEYMDGSNAGALAHAVEYSIEPQKWYNLKLVVTPQKSTLYIDGKQLLSYVPKGLMPKYAIASGIDERTKELVLKVVNRMPVSYSPEIRIEGAGNIAKVGKSISLCAKSEKEENSFKYPHKIYPIEKKFEGFSKCFRYNFAPYSYTILRIKVDNDTL